MTAGSNVSAPINSPVQNSSCLPAVVSVLKCRENIKVCSALCLQSYIRAEWKFSFTVPDDLSKLIIFKQYCKNPFLAEDSWGLNAELGLWNVVHCQHSSLLRVAEVLSRAHLHISQPFHRKLKAAQVLSLLSLLHDFPPQHSEDATMRVYI